MTRVHSPVRFISPGRAVAGGPAGKKMIMTQDMARKTAIRRRMAATGEPYSVASNAITPTRPRRTQNSQK
jgi:hypothetical protein